MELGLRRSGAWSSERRKNEATPFRQWTWGGGGGDGGGFGCLALLRSACGPGGRRRLARGPESGGRSRLTVGPTHNNFWN
jgi:hypothetical protein